MQEILLLIALYAAYAASPGILPDPTPSKWATDGKGKAYLLYRGYQQAAGTLRPYNQGASPSCVGTAAAMALQIMHPGTKFSPEWLYALSREEFISPWNMRSGGSYCGWAAHVCKTIGVLPAATYAIMDYDLSEYDADLANHWARGPPKELRHVAKLYRSPGYHKIESWEELRGAISNGFPVIVGSNVGFGPTRGQVKRRDGSLRARWWSRWSHAMVIIGVDDRSNKGALILNSWGDEWVTGPKRFQDEPDGAFWASKKSIERMITSYDDAFVILPIEGLK